MIEEWGTSGKNIKSLKFAYYLGNVLAITPWYNFSTRKFKSEIVNKIYCVIITAGLGSLWWFGNKVMDVVVNQMYQTFLTTLKDLLPMLSIEYLVLIATFTNQNDWKDLLERLSNLDNIILDYNRQSRINTCRRMMCAHILFIILYLYKLSTAFSLTGLKYFSSYGNNFVVMYFSLYLVLIMSTILLAFQSKYRDLNDMLFEAVKNNNKEESLTKEIKNIAVCYRYLGTTVEKFNSIFGWPLCFMILHSIVDLLNCINFILKSLIHSDFDWRIFVSCSGMCLISMGGTVYVLLCCDITLTEGIKIKKLCYKLQDDFELPLAAITELVKLVDMTKYYEPLITAANFFVVERRAVLGIISIITTYMIVLIQFNTTTSSEWNMVH